MVAPSALCQATMTHAEARDTEPYPGERTFEGTRASVRYVLHEASTQPDALVVGFSAQHPPSKTPRYSGIKVLRDIPCHRLYILDDHGPLAPYPRGCWYLGERRSFTVAQAVCELINTTV